MPTSVIGERVGWPYAERTLRHHVARIRPGYAPRRLDPADRLVWEIGDVAQCDLWFPDVDIPIGGGKVARLPVLTMVLAWSKYPVALMIPTRRRPDLLLGMWEAISTFGRVPRRLLWDNEAGIGRHGKIGREVAEFCGTLGVKLVQAKPYDPETKGIVERFNSYLETSFLPGRTFTSADDFNAQLASWLTRVRGKSRAAKTSPESRAWPKNLSIWVLCLPLIQPCPGQWKHGWDAIITLRSVATPTVWTLRGSGTGSPSRWI